MGLFTRAVAFAVVLTGLGCGPHAACATSADCPRTQVCGFSGTCGPLEPPRGARFAASRWMLASDWGIAGAGRPLGDRLHVGAGREGLLAFGPLPEPNRILRALLVLHPHPESTRASEPRELVAERVDAFVGGALPRRANAQPRAFSAATRHLAAGPPRPVRMDVTDAARGAAQRHGRRLFVLLRAEGAAPLDFASPFADRLRIRPRLELLLH